MNTDNTDATGFSQMAVVLLSLPHRASEVFRRSTECASVPREGRTFQFDARTGWGGSLGWSILQKLYIPLYPLLCGEILVSSRLGPRMESAMNMSEQAHDNMSALPRQNDDDDGCSKCISAAPFLLL